MNNFRKNIKHGLLKKRRLLRLEVIMIVVLLVAGGLYFLPSISRAEEKQEPVSGYGRKSDSGKFIELHTVIPGGDFTELPREKQSEDATELRMEGQSEDATELRTERQSEDATELNKEIQSEGLTEAGTSGEEVAETEKREITKSPTEIPAEKSTGDTEEQVEPVKKAESNKSVMALGMGQNDLQIQGVIDKVYAGLKDSNQQAKWLEKSSTSTWNTTNTAIKWDGTVADNKTGDAISNPSYQIEPVDGIWQVYSPQQLVLALNTATSGQTIRLMADMDLSGGQYNWIPAKSYTDVIFDGQYHTIFNLGAYETSFLGEISGCELKNIVFDSAKVVTEKSGPMGIGIIIGNGSSGKVTRIKNVRVENSLFASGRAKGSMGSDAYLAPMGYAKYMNIENLYTDNNVLASVSDHVGGVVGRPNYSTIKNSFSVNSTVIAGGDHSGGFVSCVDDGLTISDCFTNNDVYGNATTGVFIGAVWPAVSGSSFIRCYASGTIEGKTSIGGFIGCIQDGITKVTISFEDCYSTSIVGMQVGGNHMGGFIGDLTKASDTVKFNNCYVAGEVGHVDTELNLGQGSNANNIGGFTGFDKPSQTTYNNCYYDKQTTAMRERSVGNAPSRDGIKGVLTATSQKSGSGLAGIPGTTGFVEFSNTNWVYDGRSQEDNDKHNCLYPQLNVFESPVTGNWDYGENGENYNDLVQAYSLASVSTVHQEVWDYDANETALPETTYDTVRDITQRFTLTSYAIAGNNSSMDIQWKKGKLVNGVYVGAISDMPGSQKLPVIGFLGPTYNGTYERDYNTADKFAPGIEWVTVEVTINGNATGTRKIRIIPTTNLIPGDDRTNLTSGSTYDHTDDFRMAYSTAHRMSIDMGDITVSSYPGTNLQYKGIDLNTIPDLSGPGSSLDVSVFKVNGITSKSVNPAGIIDYIKEDLIANGSANRKIWESKLNGTAEFEDTDQGRYIIEYTWNLSDGRYIRDSKMIVIRAQKHNVEIQVEDMSGTPLADQMKLHVEEYQDNAVVPSLIMPPEEVYAQSAYEAVGDGKHALLLSKKRDPHSEIKEIQFTLNTIDGPQTKTVTDIDNEGANEFNFQVVYYYGSYEQGGNYYVQSETVTKKYVFKYQEDTDCYVLLLDSEFNIGGVEKYDVDSDIEFVVRLDAKKKNGFLKLKKITTNETGQEQYYQDKFIFKLTGVDDPAFTSSVVLTSATGKNEKVLTLPAGRYILEEIIPMQYEFKEVKLENSPPSTVNKTEILIEDSQTESIYYKNQKTNQTGGAGGITNVLTGNKVIVQ